ncbi:MAG: hypothetical protein AAF289_06860 [Cyanobacteria bacterium P01_A01_bin.135]
MLQKLPHTTAFLVCLGLTLLVWVGRGLGVLTFIPGGLLWLLLLLTVGSAVMDIIQRTRRW